MTTQAIDPTDKTAAKLLGAKCDQCPLRYQPCVMPWNVEAANILFVGEAPGTQEVATGVPFIGPSGALLDKVIERSGHDPMAIGKTNACMCKPFRQLDGSMTPPMAAVEACSDALRATIESFAGETIVTLGATATEALDALASNKSQGGILSRRGVWCAWDYFPPSFLQRMGFISRTINYLPILHPAFVLRSPGYIQKFIDDVTKAFEGPHKRHEFLDVPYKVVADFEQLKEMILDLLKAPLVSFDVETEHLQWYDTPDKRACNVLCLVFAGRLDLVYIVPDTTLTQPRVIEFLQRFFNDKTVLAHNGKFDAAVMLARLGINIRLCDDSMLAHGVLSEGKRGHGLKELAQELFQVPDYEDQWLAPVFKKHKMSQKNRNYGVIPREILYRYAAVDGVITLALYHELRKQLEAQDLLDLPYRKVLVRASNALTKVEVNGIPIDYNYLEKVEDRVVVEVERLAEHLAMQVTASWGLGSPKVEKLYELIKRSKTKRFNPNSDDQVSLVLYELFQLKLPKSPMKPTSTNTGEECLLLLLEAYPNHPFIETLREHRRVEKIRNTYVTKLLALADDNEVVHVNFNILGTETGRLSADDSLHGIPNPEDESVPEDRRFGAMIRGAFRAPKGYRLVAADYSQAELRVAACESNEPFFLRAYREGLDVHNETVKLMCGVMGVNYDTLDHKSAQYKNIRRLAKNINFGGLIYLGGYRAIAALTGADPQMVKMVMEYYFDKLETMRNWQRDQFRLAKKYGYVVNRFGRKRRFILQTMQNIDEIRKASVNAPIQGGASDLTLLSICQMVESGIRVVHTVHDSILALASDNEAESVAHTMQQIMVSTGEQYYNEVPWQVDIDYDSEFWYQKRPKI